MSGIGISCKCITYGRVEYLEESIESFLGQKYDGPKELVIVNDYPLQELKFEHPEVRIFNTPRFDSIGAKENFAVAKCKYDTIAVWDDDDVALPNHLENINRYFPGHHLLHWNKGVFLHSYKIAAIKAIGNSGIVYSREIWEEIGGHPLENAGYDMTFVNNIRRKTHKIMRAFPEDPSWFYTWGSGSYHMSGLGKDVPGRENVLVRHAAHIENLRIQGKIPEGEVMLNPHWKHDYIAMLSDFRSKTEGMSPDTHMRNLNGFAISEELLQWLVHNLPENGTVLEFGSGTGTIELAKNFKTYSVECNPRWVGLSDRANYILAPIVKPQDGPEWYNLDTVLNGLKDVKYDAIVIDGPNVRDGNRYGFLKHISHFRKDVPIIIDDTHRRYEKQLANDISKAVGRPAVTIKGHEKSFDVV